MKTEKWNDYEIRFVEMDGEWWALANDIAKALGYVNTTHMTDLIDEEDKNVVFLVHPTGQQHCELAISEIGIYEAIFRTEKKNTEEMKQWVKRMLKNLRRTTGIEGSRIMRMQEVIYDELALIKKEIRDVRARQECIQ